LYKENLERDRSSTKKSIGENKKTKRREIEMWKKGDRVLLSMKDLVFKE